MLESKFEDGINLFIASTGKYLPANQKTQIKKMVSHVSDNDFIRICEEVSTWEKIPHGFNFIGFCLRRHRELNPNMKKKSDENVHIASRSETKLGREAYELAYEVLDIEKYAYWHKYVFGPLWELNRNISKDLQVVINELKGQCVTTESGKVYKKRKEWFNPRSDKPVQRVLVLGLFENNEERKTCFLNDEWFDENGTKCKKPTHWSEI